MPTKTGHTFRRYVSSAELISYRVPGGFLKFTPLEIDQLRLQCLKAITLIELCKNRIQSRRWANLGLVYCSERFRRYVGACFTLNFQWLADLHPGTYRCPGGDVPKAVGSAAQSIRVKQLRKLRTVDDLDSGSDRIILRYILHIEYDRTMSCPHPWSLKALSLGRSYYTSGS
ncbi:unnamed protein product [Dibothriocephalus latus]|uniref:Uncharacterized protein n=1 Tax=Dibothriocephalus latus TaxID=60516 RepID=A0A3P6QC32_DIBLA|nr:unnamed protein product [Dibothriocephalus latus]